tara:strand:+ start:123 stop:455 length:333 start_codon:yes stop_codon:yes gene_type:complete
MAYNDDPLKQIKDPKDIQGISEDIYNQAMIPQTSTAMIPQTPTGLEGKGSGAMAQAQGPMGAMETIKRNTSTPFAMKGSPFQLSINQSKIMDTDKDGDIDKKDLKTLRNE